MFNYYSLDVIPIILNRFKVNNIIFTGFLDEETMNPILKYCEDNDCSYDSIFSQDVSILEIIPNLINYDAIFLNDDPNWYTVFNELKLVKEHTEEFPLVFICNNIFPHKRRDSYVNPEIIPKEFRNDYSTNLFHENVMIWDDYYHASEENTPKNGVLTAIEDFLSENSSISIMNIKLVNGITILYPQNNISYIRVNKLFEEIEGHEAYCEDMLDNIIENELLLNYFSQYNVSENNLDVIDNFKKEITQKEKLIGEYKNKVKLHDDELSYKNAQIDNIDSKLSLQDSKIKNIESKLVNKEDEISNLNIKLQNANDVISSLKVNISKNKELESKLNNEIKSNIAELNNKDDEISNLNIKLQNANDVISSLKVNISKNKELESKLNNEIKSNIAELNNKEDSLHQKDNQIRIKQIELNEKKDQLNLIKRHYTHQLSKLNSKEYCIGCYKEEISNNHCEIEYLKKDNFVRKIFSPLAYVYLIFKSNPKELSLNFKLYKAIKNSKCFDIGYYLNLNKDLINSKWCKYFSPELHYVCNGFDEKRRFNKKYFNRNSKKELLEYIINCP